MLLGYLRCDTAGGGEITNMQFVNLPPPAASHFEATLSTSEVGRN